MIIENLGLGWKEEQVSNQSMVSACVLKLINPKNNHVIFQSFGKGKSHDWARASAWGEMIERIQNMAFYMILIYPTQPEIDSAEPKKFRYFPDEKTFILGNESNSDFFNYFSRLAGDDITGENTGKEMIGVPFLNLFENKPDYLPFRMVQGVVGSNGMCSGNTREEALNQGLCEIFERYVLKEFYLNPFCPPDISVEWFKDTDIYNHMMSLKLDLDYNITIKDCSMNKGYPVLGVLIRNNTGHYAFHLGADPSPITALERCFTEMFQGGAIHFLPLQELEANGPCDLDTLFWKRHFSLTISAYSGHWPDKLLSDKPDYEFTGFNHPVSVSDHEDLQYLLKIIKNGDKQIFIRDNSFLGHPAYYIYIPGMSEITSLPDKSFLSAFLRFDHVLPVLWNMADSTVNKRAALLDALDIYIGKSPHKEFRINDYFRFFNSHPLTRISITELMALLDVSLLNETFGDYFGPDECEKDSLLSVIDQQNRNFKLHDLFKVMNGLPRCFHCETCQVSGACNYSFVMDIWEKMKRIMVG